MPNSTKIYIVDDNTFVCDALSWLCTQHGLLVETYADGQAFLAKYSTAWQGCILLDIRMPKIDGLSVLDQLAARYNSMPVIILTGHGDITMAVRSIKSGAIDFITKPFEPSLLITKIQAALQQNQAQQNLLKQGHTMKSLTPREQEILEHIVAGKLNKQIAYDLNLSIKTVEAHRAQLMKKMQANSVAELVKNYLLTKNQFTQN
jgi:FixJ family two-component response regulator